MLLSIVKKIRTFGRNFRNLAISFSDEDVHHARERKNKNLNLKTQSLPDCDSQRLSEVHCTRDNSIAPVVVDNTTLASTDVIPDCRRDRQAEWDAKTYAPSIRERATS